MWQSKDPMNQATRKDKERLLRTRMTRLKAMWGSHIPLDDNWRHMHELTDDRLDKDLTNLTDHLRFERTLNVVTRIGKVGILFFLALGAVMLLFVIGQMF